MKIMYTNTARQDLREIYEYIAYTLLVPDTAKMLSEKIMQEIRSLEIFPGRNPLHRDEPWHTLAQPRCAVSSCKKLSDFLHGQHRYRYGVHRTNHVRWQRYQPSVGRDSRMVVCDFRQSILAGISFRIG